MIDLIKLRKKNISDTEKSILIEKSNLKQQTAQGKTYFDNATTKNFEGGFYINIDAENTLKVEGSLHKYYNWLQSKKLLNNNRFTITQAYQTFKNLIENKGFEPQGVLVTQFEIGANIPISIDAKIVLSKVLYISVFEDLSIKKPFMINPKYRDARHITTYFNRGIKIYYRMYDKHFEMRMKEKATPNGANIIRIETVNLNVQKTLLTDFMKLKSLTLQKINFQKKWDKVYFDFEVEAPSGTNLIKINIAKEILLNGIFATVEKYKSLRAAKNITERGARTILEFCKDWNENRHLFLMKQTETSKTWKNAYISEIQQLN